jgi:serine/threonine-protein kinase
VVHRDIKPENILLEEGHAVVADFGVARAASSAGEEKLTETGIAVGTPAYLSPEQASGDVEVDGRSDVYSLGCVLYEMLAGEPPITGSSVESILRKHISAEPAPVRIVRPSVPDSVAHVVDRSLGKAPADRYGSAGEFGEALRRALSKSTEQSSVSRRPWLVAAAVAATAATVVISVGWPFSESDTHNSIAVLPCEDTSGDSSGEHFSEAITDDIITELSKLGSLKVINVTSALRYRGTDLTPVEIASELGVTRLVRCTARESGGRASISAQLIEPESGAVIWADRYDRAVENVLEISSDVAVELAASLNAVVSSDERVLLGSGGKVHPDAYRAYQRGRQLFRQNTPTDWERAVDYFHQAIAYDSSYAEAHAGLAEVHALLPTIVLGPATPFVEWMRWNDESLTRALRHAERALELDSTLAQAHAARGLVLRFWRDPVEGLREIRRAIELEPSSAWAHHIYVSVVSAQGRQDDALGEAQLTVSLDPHDTAARRVLGTAYTFLGQYDRAVVELEKSIELAPAFPTAQVWLMLTHVFAGRYDSAKEVMRTWMELTGGDPEALVPFFEAAAGDRPVSDALPVIEQTEYVFGPFWAAQMYAVLGETDPAFGALERALEMNDPNLLQYLRASPAMESLRVDARYAVLVEGLPF